MMDNMAPIIYFPHAAAGAVGHETVRKFMLEVGLDVVKGAGLTIVSSVGRLLDGGAGGLPSGSIALRHL